MAYRHLRERSEYEDLYDRITIEHLKDKEKMYQELDRKVWEDMLKKYGKEKAEKDFRTMGRVFYWFEEGKRADERDKKIEEWMERDRKRDEKVDDATPPNKVLCMACGIYMEEESRTLHDDVLGKKPDRVMFLMRCNECRKGKWIYEGGEERVFKPKCCDKCNAEYEKKEKTSKNKIVTTYTCPRCDNKETDELDLTPPPEPTEKEIRQFRINRAKYCLSPEKLREYREGVDNMNRLAALVKEIDGDKDVVEAAKKLKKLTVVGLKEHLSPILKKAGYEKLKLGDPVVSREFYVEFVVHDAKSEREKYDSEKQLKKLLQESLIDTNWRLMSDGIQARLGILTGRLRGYDSEEDIKQLMREKLGKSKNAKVNGKSEAFISNVKY